ncbi:MAG: hypothetical protein H9535_18805 [Ignavibacteria bacterium]|nr:hypothetical protein [Ignavibacteria bacterium]
MANTIFLRCAILLLIFQAGATIASAQTDTSRVKSDSAVKLTVTPFRVSGGVTLSGDFYTTDGIESRRPANNLMAIARINIALFEQVNLPFEAFIGTNQNGFRQPFNQFGISPTFFNWLTLHAGWFSMRFSDLTFGDIRMLGGGVEFRPGNFRLAALYGSTNQAVPYDISTGGAAVAGAFTSYSRPVVGLKLGYGDENIAFINFQAIRVSDDTTSLQTPANADISRLARPQENTVFSTTFGFGAFDGKLRFTAEIAGSAYSADTRSQSLAALTTTSTFQLPAIPAEIFTPRLSSQIDAAAKATLTIAPTQDFMLALGGQYVGPGFVSLGYAQLQNDVLDGTISPSLRLFNGGLSLRGTVGIRVNNLIANRTAPLQRLIASGSVSIQPVQAFGLDVQYSNYGIRSTPRNDTLRIENVSQSLTLSPRLNFEAFGGMSGIFGSYSLNNVNDLNVLTKETNTNQTESVMLSWTLGLPSGLSLATTGFYSDIAQSIGRTSILNIGQTASYSFLSGALSTSLTLGYGIVGSELTTGSMTTRSSDGQITGQVSVSYSIGESGKFGTLSLNVNNNNYAFGNPARGRNFGEWTALVQYSIGF